MVCGAAERKEVVTVCEAECRVTTSNSTSVDASILQASTPIGALSYIVISKLKRRLAVSSSSRTLLKAQVPTFLHDYLTVVVLHLL